MANEYDNDLLNRDHRIMGGPLLPVIVANMITYEKLVDCLVNALVNVPYEHHEIHDGNLFIADTVDLTLAAAATLSLATTIPAGLFIHWRHIVNAGGACHVKVKEGVTLAGGGAVVIYNANRNGPAAPFAALTKPVITFGTTILDYVVASGSGPKAAGGSSGLFDEIVTQDNQTYSIEVTNLTNAAIAASIVVSLYPKTIGICP